MGLTSKQWFQIVSGSISSLITAGALFTSLFGETMTLKIIACLGLANLILSSVGTVLSGVDSSAKDVQTAAANKTLSPTAQVSVLNAATDVPGTQKLVNPEMAANPATSSKVTSQ
jgi:hypothetical protein